MDTILYVEKLANFKENAFTADTNVGSKVT